MGLPPFRLAAPRICRGVDIFSSPGFVLQLDLVFFDTTSIYFEGHGGESIGQ